ncbi:MAG TPA: hypothetical protein ACFCUD_15245 [Cyclobacteriaceae bacterium]
MKKNKLSNGLSRLLNQKQVAHFSVKEFTFDDVSRKNYFDLFNQSQVSAIVEC